MSSSNKPKTMDEWRRFFRSTKADIFQVIEYGIRIAASDCPKEFKLRRDLIAETLFTCKLTQCVGCNRVELAVPNPQDFDGQDEEEESSPGDGRKRIHSDHSNKPLNSATPSSNFSYDEAEALTDELEEESRIIGEVMRIRQILENSQDESIEALFDSLRRLELMRLSVSTLEATHIGKAVNRMKKHGKEQIRQLARNLVDVWKALCIDFYGARGSVKGKSESPDSVNPPTVNTPTGYEEEEEEGLPSPPLDDFGAFLGVGTNLMEVSKFFDGMDEDGNPRSNMEFDKIPENGRNRMLEKSNMDKERNMERRKPESRDVEIVSMKDKHVVKPDTVSKQNKAYNTQAGVGRTQNLGSEQKVNSETKLARSLDTTRKHRPEQHAKSNFPGEVLDQKLEAAKKRLQENYQQAQNAKKQRTIQTLELSDLPKNGSGSSRSVHMKPGNHNRHRPNIRR